MEYGSMGRKKNTKIRGTAKSAATGSTIASNMMGNSSSFN